MKNTSNLFWIFQTYNTLELRIPTSVWFIFSDGTSVLPPASICHSGWMYECCECGRGRIYVPVLSRGERCSFIISTLHYPIEPRKPRFPQASLKAWSGNFWLLHCRLNDFWSAKHFRISINVPWHEMASFFYAVLLVFLLDLMINILLSLT